ncbi:hypothetical protein ACFQZ4_46000 [Catellatospora coxensis]|uniref:Uncharacterized protein n=1 Tax=Catellatospora coxensis TaxID=310354 RepID=A0A8J3P6F9_9ACTN|nr:hypothetical protein [Catellatospora coxensis]GIG05673.1 hypothetical protein Cco03nite_23730 [Catellatospora coxensis]
MRAATPDDAAVFEQFECGASGNLWDVEVERQVQDKLTEWTFRGTAAAQQDSQALLVLTQPTGEAVAIAAYERYGKLGIGAERFEAVRLYALAVANEWQGRTFDDGERVSHVLMSAVLGDISDRYPGHRVFGRVHKDNVRSLALLRAFEFVVYAPTSGDDYVYVTTQ